MAGRGGAPTQIRAIRITIRTGARSSFCCRGVCTRHLSGRVIAHDLPSANIRSSRWLRGKLTGCWPGRGCFSGEANLNDSCASERETTWNMARTAAYIPCRWVTPAGTAARSWFRRRKWICRLFHIRIPWGRLVSTGRWEALLARRGCSQPRTLVSKPSNADDYGYAMAA